MSEDGVSSDVSSQAAEVEVEVEAVPSEPITAVAASESVSEAAADPAEFKRQPTYEALPFAARIDEPFGGAYEPIADPLANENKHWEPQIEGADGEQKVESRRNSQEKRNSLDLPKAVKRRSITPSAVVFTEADSKKLYGGPLVMHKWYNPLEQLGPALPRSDDTKDPIKVTLPFGKVALGLMPSLKQPHAEIPVPPPAPANQTWYIFSTAGDDAIQRAKMHGCLLRFLLPADLIFVATMYFQSIYSADGDPYMGMTDDLAFTSTLLGVLLGFLAMWQRDSRLLTIFICVFIVDSLVNLVRLSTIFQFVQFALQLLICYVGGQFQAILGTSWFPSSYSRD